MTTEITGIGTNSEVNINKTSLKSSQVNFSRVLKNAAQGTDIDLDEIFNTASETYCVPVALLKAVAKAESNFNPDATSSCGAKGIMQLMSSTASSLGVTNAYDPKQNIMGGAKLLSQLLHQFDGDTVLAVAAYNAGSGNVLKYDGIPPFEETQNYVKAVMANMGQSFTAGTVSSSSSTSSGIFVSGNYSSDNAILGTLLESMLLSGAYNGNTDNLSGLMSVISNSAEVSGSKIASIYQMVMMSNSEDDSNVII